jgi:hypothetical protein
VGRTHRLLDLRTKDKRPIAADDEKETEGRLAVGLTRRVIMRRTDRNPGSLSDRTIVPGYNENQLMSLRVELSELGGVAGLHRMIALEGTRLRVMDAGQVRLERDIPKESLESIGNRVRALEGAHPRRAYGRERNSSDVLTVRVAITDNSRRAEIEVVQDPEDPAPPQFWDVVRGLRQLTRSG